MPKPKTWGDFRTLRAVSVYLCTCCHDEMVRPNFDRLDRPFCNHCVGCSGETICVKRQEPA